MVIFFTIYFYIKIHLSLWGNCICRYIATRSKINIYIYNCISLLKLMNYYFYIINIDFFKNLKIWIHIYVYLNSNKKKLNRWNQDHINVINNPLNL